MAVSIFFAVHQKVLGLLLPCIFLKFRNAFKEVLQYLEPECYASQQIVNEDKFPVFHIQNDNWLGGPCR